MTVEEIVSRCETLGLESIAMTDHLNQISDVPKHRWIADDIRRIDTSLRVYFGVELDILDEESSPYSEQIRDEGGFQFAIGGPHGPAVESYDLKQIIAIQHRNQLATCQNPLISVLVHPWRFDKLEFSQLNFPWFDDLSVVPQSMTEELADAAISTGTAIEISATMLGTDSDCGERFIMQYREYLGTLAARGVHFSLGSDAHDIGELQGITAAEKVAAELEIGPDRIWHPSGAPFNQPAGEVLCERGAFVSETPTPCT